MLTYIENGQISATDIAALRKSVGWNGMEEYYADPRMATASYCRIACYDGNMLVGYVDSISNGVTDAYIQDLMVSPEYQGRGIGTELINRVVARLKNDGIYWISILFDEELAPFYKRFGFNMMLGGTMQTRDAD